MPGQTTQKAAELDQTSGEAPAVRDREVLIVGELNDDVVDLIERAEYGAGPQ